MNKYLLLTIGVTFCTSINAQSTSPEVLASSGEHFTGTNAQLSWSLGELITETYSIATNQLTQGFHQTNLILSSIEDLTTDYSIDVYPNPTSNYISVETLKNNELMNIEIFDINGKLIYHETFTEKTIINVKNYNNGSYFFKISNQKNQFIKTFQILKTQ